MSSWLAVHSIGMKRLSFLMSFSLMSILSDISIMTPASFIVHLNTLVHPFKSVPILKTKMCVLYYFLEN